MEKEKRHKILATMTILLGLFIAAMESLIGSTILPSILASLGGFDLYPWMVSAFLLALVVSTPLFGKLADHWGFYKVYVGAISIFMVGSLLCGISQSMPQLIVSRTIQGVGTAGLINLCMLYVGIAFPLTKRHKLGALVSSIWALASLLGPAIGAVIAAYSSWRFAFLVNVPLCILILLGTQLFLKRLPHPPPQGPFDIKGASYFTVATIALLLAIVEWKNPNFKTEALILSLVAFGVYGLLINHLRKVERGFISLKPLVKHPTVALSMGIGAICGAMLFSSSNFLPLLVQGALGEPIKQVGYVITSMALGTCMGSVLTALLLGRLGFKSTLIVSFGFLSLGIFQYLQINQESTMAQILLANFCTGTGIGMSSNCSIVATQNFSPKSQLGTNTALFSFFRSIGGMLAIALLGTIQINAFSTEISKTFHSKERQELEFAINHPEAILDNENREKLSESMLHSLEVSLANSIHWAFLAYIPVGLIHLALSLKMPKLRPHEISLVPDPEAIEE